MLAPTLDHVEVAELARRLDDALGGDDDLETVVLGQEAPFERWGAAQRAVYNALYVVHVLSRWVEVDVDRLLRALTALHLLEAACGAVGARASTRCTPSAARSAAAGPRNPTLVSASGDCPRPRGPGRAGASSRRLRRHSRMVATRPTRRTPLRRSSLPSMIDDPIERRVAIA
ncbi:hypothetical protein PHK61_26475 [Actinomycetospora lutea]|uniref:hypothetical protein n=1 Tax=Actinomycetospora lutea TaxID=663604 RepID=UPI00236670D3|nr:hypothetical protein [Actinomycetospora lutea]MDD7941966.1 hypothetical protein [Actinomycetospora lutea]